MSPEDIWGFFVGVMMLIILIAFTYCVFHKEDLDPNSNGAKPIACLEKI